MICLAGLPPSPCPAASRTLPAAPPADVRERCERLAEQMLDGGEATAAQKNALVQALAAYKPEAVAALADRGCRVRFTDEVEGGRFSARDSAHWAVLVSKRKPAGFLYGILLHEMAHAIDWKQGEKSGTWRGNAAAPSATYASMNTPTLRESYDAYLLRSAVDVAPFCVAQLEKADEYIASRYGEGMVAWGEGEVDIHYGKPVDGRQQVELKGLPLPALPQYPREEHFVLADGRSADLKVNGPRDASISIPEGYRPQMAWSAYAASKNDHPEYFAEAVSHYLFSPEQRQRLQERDPAMFDLVSSLDLEADWRKGAPVPAPEGERLEAFVDSIDVLTDERVHDLDAYYGAMLPKRKK